MASLAPSRLPSVSSNRSSTSSSHPSNPKNSGVYRHQHSLSSSTLGTQHLGSLLSQYGPRSAGGPRQSLDVTKMLAVNGPLSPRPPLTALRPNSEIISGGRSAGAQLNSGDPSGEAEAIDKWFEDLQSYEATLEEMAAASLDVNFKEELNAIEQWFRVLSEAERTAALYSLMQSLTQVQIRFFVTVLQQMARSDPMIALLSPALNSGAQSMEQQMEAKLSQLSLKSPASPVVRHFANQSLSSNLHVPSNESFLSPNSALFNDTSNNMNDAANLLSAQRAKLNAKSANRLSAPGQLLSANSSLKSPRWGNLPGPVEEEAQSGSSSPKPSSLAGDLTLSQNSLHPTLSRTPNISLSGIESQLSPIMGGSWASQVNTPLVPMFANKDKNGNETSDTVSQTVDDASNRLAQWGAAHQVGSKGASLSATTAASSNPNMSTSLTNGFPLDDPRKFRRQSKSAASSTANGGTLCGSLNGLNSNNNSVGSSQTNSNLSSNGLSQSAAQNRNANPIYTPRSAMNHGAPITSPMAAQQAAVTAQQNWRNGLNSASLPPMNNSDPAILNNLAMMNTLAAGLNGGMNMNGMANLAAMANITDPGTLQNMANLLNARQQMQQVQNLQTLQQQLQHGGMMNNGSLLSPASGRLGMNFSFPMMSGSPTGMANKRSPGGGRGSSKPSHTPGSGSNPNEELDMKLLNDIPAWLRGLRLHKYTPNFTGCTWQEMVLMSDATLEARGVAAVGARRKMLRTFETVRIIKGMALPGDGDPKVSSTPTDNIDATGGAGNVKPTNIAPESDKDTNKS